MKIYLLVALVSASTFAVVSGRSLKQMMVTSNFVGEGTNDLTAHLLQSESKTGLNTVFSPLGTNAILAILAEGARGETRNQLAKALNLPEDTYAVRSTYHNVFLSMSEHGVLNQPELKSWFYVYKNNSIEDSYKAVMREHYLIDINEVDRYTDIDGEESEHEDKTGVKFTSTVGDTKQDDKSAHQEDAPGALKVTDNIAQESSTQKEEMMVTETTVKTEANEDNSVASVQEDPVDGQEAEVNETTVAPSEVTTESIAENQVDPTEDDPVAEGERPILEDIIARSLKSEIRSREMVSALSANRLSSMNENLRPNSRMIIFNALYFRGNWSVPMKSDGEKMTFDSVGKDVDVDSMSGEGELEMGTVPELGATVLELPYQGERYSMLIILPDEKGGLGEVIGKLSGNSIRNIGQHLTKRLVKASVPKFRFYTITKPKDALVKSGIKDIFGEESDLSGITSSKGLYLDDLVQLVTLDVDESHSSNVQLTSGIVSETRATPALFKADRPFAFVVRDRTDNLVIVAGVVHNPKNPDLEKRTN